MRGLGSTLGLSSEICVLSIIQECDQKVLHKRIMGSFKWEITQNASSFKTKQNKETCYKQRTKINSTEGTQQANFKGQPRSWEWLTRAYKEKKAGLAKRVKSINNRDKDRMELINNIYSVIYKKNAK